MKIGHSRPLWPFYSISYRIRMPKSASQALDECFNFCEYCEYCLDSYELVKVKKYILNTMHAKMDTLRISNVWKFWISSQKYLLNLLHFPLLEPKWISKYVEEVKEVIHLKGGKDYNLAFKITLGLLSSLMLSSVVATLLVGCHGKKKH